MTSRERSFYWKIGYVVGICVLVWPLFILGRPATDKKAGGGVLAQLRRDHGLSEADLGEVDPAGETIKLASLGLTNVAANILWTKANDYKMKKDWTNLSATLQQIAKLQPHFISVWKFQAWNLSYNVSAEFDDYKDRYRWVIKGIDFLMEGIDKNEFDPRLYWDQGWFTAQKIGRSDEHVQFRRLFREDDDFHASLPPELRDPTRDNWLCGKLCFKEAEDLDADGYEMKGMSPLVFHSDPPMCQINYAEALEDDGRFGEVAETAWRQAAREWHEFGSRDIRTTYRDPSTDDNLSIHLNDQEHYEAVARDRAEQLEALAPGLRKKIEQEKKDALPKKERQALDTPVAERNERQYELAGAAAEKIKVTHEEVAQRVRGPDYAKALKLADEVKKAEQMANYVSRYRQIVNFEYWRLRCEVEQTPEAIAARKAIHDADKASVEAKLQEARETYEQGLAKWRKVLDKFPALLDDQTTGEDLVEVIDRYKALLGKLDEKMPEPFVLQDVLDRYGKKSR